MIKKFAAAFVLFFVFCFSASSQDIIQSKTYPKNVFSYPLDLPPSTAGSFGELRANHFHSGLDFKTNQRIGYPVHAVFDGYVSRLRVQFGGFGNAVYITHPNGYTSVYGHLDHFSPELTNAIRACQNEQQSDLVDFTLQPWQLPIYKGQVFAWSGNTGGSAGPHLHFELRDSQTEQTINPQLFGLTIPDKVPPFIGTACIYHLNGAPFSEKTPRQFLGVKGAAGHYRLVNEQIINLSGDIGFGITANDMNNTSSNHNGVYSIELRLDGKTIYTFAVERFAFDQTHAINAYVDYPEFLSSGRWMQKCFILPGSRISLYPQSINRGIISFNDDALHEVEYIVKDIAGNTSTLLIKVKSSPPKDHPIHTITGNLFHYDQVNEFKTDKIKVSIPVGNLYDDVDFSYAMLPKKPGTFSAVHHIHNRFTPIHDYYDLWIKPDSTIGRYTDKAVIVNTAGAYAESIYEDGYIKAQARGFGDFYIRLDTIPPTIRPINIKNGSNMAALKAIFLRIGDNLSGIKSYMGYIDGKWVLMQWDYKTKILSYTFDKNITTGKHTFQLTVTDNKNNVSQFTADFYK